MEAEIIGRCLDCASHYLQYLSSKRKEIVSPLEGEKKNVVQPVQLQAMLLNVGHTHAAGRTNALYDASE